MSATLIPTTLMVSIAALNATVAVANEPHSLLSNENSFNKDQVVAFWNGMHTCLVTHMQSNILLSDVGSNLLCFY